MTPNQVTEFASPRNKNGVSPTLVTGLTLRVDKLHRGNAGGLQLDSIEWLLLWQLARVEGVRVWRSVCADHRAGTHGGKLDATGRLPALTSLRRPPQTLCARTTRLFASPMPCL